MVMLKANEPVGVLDEAANSMVTEVDAPAARVDTVGTHVHVR